MRRIGYSVAMSLDGYIAGPKGEFDWIKTDPDFDFSALFKQFDTIVAGRGTFEPMAAAGRTSMPGMKTIVVSRTLRPEDHPDVVKKLGSFSFPAGSQFTGMPTSPLRGIRCLK